MAALKTDHGIEWLCDWCFRPIGVNEFKTTWGSPGRCLMYHEGTCWDDAGDPTSTPPDPPQELLHNDG